MKRTTLYFQGHKLGSYSPPPTNKPDQMTRHVLICYYTTDPAVYVVALTGTRLKLTGWDCTTSKPKRRSLK